MKQNLTAKMVPYRSIIWAYLICFSLSIYFSHTFLIILHHLIFLSQNLLKLFLLLVSIFSKYRGKKTTQNSRLKYYTILIPLYKEQDGISSILASMKAINYPLDLLQVFLVIEEDDKGTFAAISKEEIPEYFKIIKVPDSLPKTKPKALNYAMKYVKSEYVVIYDAEDIPGPDQLIKAANIFAKSSRNIICLQAKMRFHNSSKNYLTRFFSIEYLIWFDLLLPIIERLNLPVPLGGNSNHFRVKELKKIGLWDEHNVTEDADLGIRIYEKGYSTKIIDSYTLEEAPFDIDNWVSQRSRWIKGFFQTFLVFCFKDNKSSLNIFQKIFVITFVGFSSYSFLIMPYYIIAPDKLYISKILAIVNLYGMLIYMYLSAFIALIRSRSNGLFLDILTLIFWPLYFTLHIKAAYRAIYELFFCPFRWNKTKHYFE